MNPFAGARGERNARARRPQIWIAISLTNGAIGSIFEPSKLLLEPKPQDENRSPAQSLRHARMHDAVLFLGGNGRLLLLLTAS
jgi:hypothetical protein